MVLLCHSPGCYWSGCHVSGGIRKHACSNALTVLFLVTVFFNKTGSKQMRKINLFNRNTNLPSYRRMPVSGGFNCNGEIPRFRGMTGKAHGVAECKFPSREGWRVAPAGVWFAALVALFVATPSFAEPTELDKKTVASKAYVDTKQDIIETELVDFHNYPDDETYQVPAIISYDSTSGLVGNKIGFADFNNLDLAGWNTLTGEEYENFVPNLRSVALAVQKLSWRGIDSVRAVNAYSTTFDPTSTHVNGNWPYGSHNYLVNADMFVYSLSLKQNKIAKSGYYYALNGTLTAYGNDSNANGWLNADVKGTGIVTKTATDGVVGERKIFETTDVANYHATGLTQIQQDIQDISIPTVGAMMGMISNAVDTLTWTATETTATQQYSTTFDGTANNWPAADANKIIDGTALANGLAQKQNKMTCAGWDSETHTDEHCWLWSIE
jgi:hypothetical protein